jgi:hypothetical protein
MFFARAKGRPTGYLTHFYRLFRCERVTSNSAKAPYVRRPPTNDPSKGAQYTA